MPELLKCIKCDRTLIAEEFDKHLCNIPKGKAVEIEVESYFVLKNQRNNTESIIANGTDGILYIIKTHERKLDQKPFEP